MLALHVVNWVKRLLDEGRSKRSIARITGVSRGRVHYIACGEWDRKYARHEAAKQAAQEARRFQREPTAPVKCPECGLKVQMPCQVCKTRAFIAQHGRTEGNGEAGRNGEEGPALGLRLRGKHRKRYEQVRGRRFRRRRKRGRSPDLELDI